MSQDQPPPVRRGAASGGRGVHEAQGHGGSRAESVREVIVGATRPAPAVVVTAEPEPVVEPAPAPPSGLLGRMKSLKGGRRPRNGDFVQVPGAPM